MKKGDQRYGSQHDLNQKYVVDTQKIIASYQSGDSLRTIAARYDVSTDPIIRILDENKIKRRAASPPKIDIKEACILYKQGLSFEQIANRYSCDTAAVRRALRKQNIISRSPWNKSRKHTLDETFFEKIDTEEKAYWLGFLQADGYIPKKAPWHTQCSLKIADINHLLKMAASFNSNVQPIIRTRKGKCHGSGKQYARISFGSRKIIKDLTEKGFLNFNLSGDIAILNHIPKKLLKHWLRGFIDGDGTVGRSKGSKLKDGSFGKKQSYITIFSPFKCVLDTISNILIDVKLIESINKICPDGSIWQIRYSGNQKASNIIKWLYEDATIYLDRKKSKADEIISNK